MALALAQYEDLFQLVSGYLYWRKNGLTNQEWLDESGIVRPLSPCLQVAHHCAIGKGAYICLPSESNGPNLLDEPLKGFIVNPADLPWKWVKRLATSGERVNHDSQ